MNRFVTFINPIRRLGMRKYSIMVPLFTMVSLTILSEVYTKYILKNPESVGLYAIFLFVGMIIYFAFRDGIRGGLIATVITIAYYAYIIYSRQQTGELLRTSIQTTVALAFVYTLLSLIIGWLKQKIDALIIREADERRRLQAIVQQLPVGVIVTDQNGKIVQENKKVEEILGRELRKSIETKNSVVLKNPGSGKHASSSQSPLTQSLTTGRTIIGKEFELTRRDGKILHVQVSSSLIKNKEGGVIAAASILNDITQQKELEARKDDFVNMASHELKTPITSMKLYIELLSRYLEKKKDIYGIKTIGNIMYQTERLQELVSDLLDVSRLQTGKLSFNKEVFRIDQLIHETLDNLRDSTNNQTIVFNNNQPINVLADKFRIYQVLTNLITNAIKYSSAGTAINVRVKRHNGHVIVSVKDQGIGIAKEQQKKIFDRLYQVTDSKEKTFPGLGMGLYISKEIIKRHKGKIWVESEKGNGSTFYFSIPIQKNKPLKKQ